MLKSVKNYPVIPGDLVEDVQLSGKAYDTLNGALQDVFANCSPAEKGTFKVTYAFGNISPGKDIEKMTAYQILELAIKDNNIS